MELEPHVIHNRNYVDKMRLPSKQLTSDKQQNTRILGFSLMQGLSLPLRASLGANIKSGVFKPLTPPSGLNIVLNIVLATMISRFSLSLRDTERVSKQRSQTFAKVACSAISPYTIHLLQCLALGFGTPFPATLHRMGNGPRKNRNQPRGPSYHTPQ